MKALKARLEAWEHAKL